MQQLWLYDKLKFILKMRIECAILNEILKNIMDGVGNHHILFPPQLAASTNYKHFMSKVVGTNLIAWYQFEKVFGEILFRLSSADIGQQGLQNLTRLAPISQSPNLEAPDKVTNIVETFFYHFICSLIVS